MDAESMSDDINEHLRGMGVMIMETTACGTAAVAYNVSDLRDSLRSMDMGILLELENAEQLVETITWLLIGSNLRKPSGKHI